ncbi:MAG: thiamine-phosphate kinase [candidate division Zixibacteria bacterium]|nr:thiamine-phosphate kinase [candidate division Zixibacteria bacterium]
MTSLISSGEFGLIRRIRNRQPSGGDGVIAGIGDDAAAVLPTPGTALLYTTDTFVEGLDFDLDFSTWPQIGFKSMAANASDIAAMGGTPRYALVTLCLPSRRTPEEVDLLYEGMHRFNETCGASVHIIGGDLSATDGPTVLSITLIGEADPARIVFRSGALPGDALCVTGDIGGSEAGLRLLLRRRKNPAFAIPDASAETLEKHRTPRPRLREANLLAASGNVHAMIDISDGLSSDALHLAENSHTGLCIEADTLPVRTATRVAAEALGIPIVDLALNSGEEFELLCAVAPDAVSDLAAELMAETGVLLTRIGFFTTKDLGCLLRTPGETRPLVASGYEHFAFHPSPKSRS